jgi:hypothetical protein
VPFEGLPLLYDLFICHATEDKETFVRPLVNELRKDHVEVWFDEFSLLVGDSLRESIDKGLSQSRFGVVVLSPSFFQKRWTARELNGLVAREMAGEGKLILPVWHGVRHEDVVRCSPPLADVLALDSRKGAHHVAKELLRRVRPQQSPLVVAREELIAFGMTPPVVTDQWWLQVVLDSSRLDAWGMAIPAQSVWGRWSFPLPDGEAGPDAMGLRLAWTALQRNWTQVADDRKITQITHPVTVLAFIASQPGLTETCHDFPQWLATYAPQLTIPGFGGPFEADFDELLKSVPSAREVSLRRPRRRRSAARVACQFVQGDIGGPTPSYYSHFDYLIWLLSNGSDWLPEDVRALLRRGMRDWDVWSRSDDLVRKWDRPFLKHLGGAGENRIKFELTRPVKDDLREIVKESLQNLGLDDDPALIVRRFLTLKYINHTLEARRPKGID